MQYKLKSIFTSALIAGVVLATTAFTGCAGLQTQHQKIAAACEGAATAADSVALATEQGFQYLDAPPLRLCARDTPVPYHPDLFAAHHPDDQRIVDGALQVVRF
jgi:pyruvate/2-oxoglutarate/acetoin dehydrogenase E1 component